MTVATAVSAPDPVPDSWCTAQRHGTLSARTMDGCKCQVTRDLWARYQRGRDWDALQGKPRRIDATGTLRRLRALQRLGWTSIAIADRMGVTRDTLRHLMRDKRWVSRRNYELVCRAYDELSMQLPEETPSVRHLRNYAEQQGWPPPLAWDDDEIDNPKAKPRKGSWTGPVPPDMAAVIRFVDTGERPKKLTHTEAAIAYRWLRERGFSGHEIEHRWNLKPERYQEGRAS